MNPALAPHPADMATAPARPSVVQVVIKELETLHAAYIPLFSEGGLFISTTREYRLGDPIYILLTLPDDSQRHSIAGKVAWITPARAAGMRSVGVGIRFPREEKSQHLKARIEELLGASLASDRMTQTI
ncbi:MAG: PilZ domain-containing protein [Bordetella sp.]|nr:PilZ domain-containing protein [Bordetella sp.]